MRSDPAGRRDPIELAKVYLVRANSPRAIGNTRQWIENCRLAADAAAGTEHDFYYLTERSFAEAVSGGPASAVATRERIVRVAKWHGYDAMIGAAQMRNIDKNRERLRANIPTNRAAFRIGWR